MTMTIKQLLDSWLTGFDSVLTTAELSDVYQALAVIIPTILSIGGIVFAIYIVRGLFGK